MALTKLNNKAVANITTLPVALGDMVFISSQTASASASISFTTGIDSTYKEYVFYFVNMHPATNDTAFQFQCSIDSGSNYNVTMTTTRFKAGHTEDGTYSVLNYEGGSDQAQGTSYQTLTQNAGNVSDESVSGMLHLFNPSSTTYVKHFMANFNTYQHGNATYNDYTAGYFNNTNDIDAISFKFASGNIDSGKILMFGIN
jgi:hypothetical protein